MKNNRDAGIRQKPSFFGFSLYFAVIGYVFVALFIRLIVWSPVAVWLVKPLGLDFPWIALLTPVLLVTIILPMRFSFAQGMMAAVRGGYFSIREAVSLAQYREKLSVSLRHALRLLYWSIPLLVTLGWLYYVMVWMDVFKAIRAIAAFARVPASVLSAVYNFFAGIFGGDGITLDYGLKEGVFVVSVIGALTVLILAWGAWRCSEYRYLWACRRPEENDVPVRIRNGMRGHRWKQLFYGAYNLFLWLPSLFCALLIAVSVHSKVSEFISVYFETKGIEPITITLGEAVIMAVGLLLHLLILPARRGAAARFADYALCEKEG